MDLSLLRNVGIVAHIDAGKTTTSERILYYSGINHRLGEVDQGSATMDWMPQEQERGITITAAATTCFWTHHQNKYQINIIDTPGHVDFTIEVERSLRVMDGAIVVICATSGVQPQTETVWHQVDKFKVPRLVFVNKLDRTGANFDKALLSLQESFNCEPLPINIPYFKDQTFSGVIDLLSQKLHLFEDSDFGKSIIIKDIPTECLVEADKARQKLLEAASLFDDNILEALLDNKDIEHNKIREAIAKGCQQLKIVPVFAGAAYSNRGVQNLMDGIVDFLPDPSQSTKVQAIDKNDQHQEITADSNGDPLALVFKVHIDPYAGMLYFLRVYAGTLKVGQSYWNQRLQKHERILKLFRMHSHKKQLLKEISAGDIAAVVGFNQAQTGDTLSTKNHPLLLERITFPQPVIEVALELRSGQDAQALDNFLAKMVIEDPSLKYYKDRETGQSMLSGMGELHLDIALDRLHREAKLEVNIGKPQVALREAIDKKVSLIEVFDKPLMGKPSYAKVELELLPADNHELNLIEFSSQLQCEPQVLALIEEGCNLALQSGVIAGNPVINTKVIVKSVILDKNNLQLEACKIAAATAVRKCLLAGNCKVLSPQMKIETTTPEEFLGNVINDLNQRGAKIINIKDQGNQKIVVGYAALKNLIGYMTQLRSITQGKGIFIMEFDHFK